MKQRKQELYARTYPFVGKMAAKKHYGDAASTTSHIRLMEQLLDMSSDDGEGYYFMFEDDAVFREPFRSTGAVQAPSDAHVAFLVPYATKKVKANDGEVRVVNGYGAMGYVVTRTRAALILKHLRGHSMPFDVAVAGAAHDLRFYQPVGWPLVGHRPGSGGSRRRAINKYSK